MIYKFTRKEIIGEYQIVKEVEIKDIEINTCIHLEPVLEYLKSEESDNAKRKKGTIVKPIP